MTEAAESTRWRRGETGYARDTGNEQVTPLPAGQTFTGQWKRVDQTKGFIILYGSNQPFSMFIDWSKDGITKDPDPFATITPQVRNALGLYTVISSQEVYFRPYYRIRVVNGAAPQAFVASDSILLPEFFPGYHISVDGPIPILGLGHLNVALQWGHDGVQWRQVKLLPNGEMDQTALKTAIEAVKTAVQNIPAPLPFPSAYPLPTSQVTALTPPNAVAVNNMIPAVETGLAKEATLQAVKTAVQGIQSGIIISPPSATGRYAIYLNDTVGSALPGYVFVSVFNPPLSPKILNVRLINYSLGDSGQKGSSKALRRISACSLGALQPVTNILKYDTLSPNCVAEVRTANPVVVTGALMKSFPGGSQSLAQGDMWWTPQDGNSLILHPGEGVCFTQVSAGATTELLNFGIEWNEA